MTKTLVDSRNQVQQRIVDGALRKGADAVLAMHFDTSKMSSN